jgi:hypothetical protein
MMVAARTSETSVDIQLRTWQYIPEDSEVHTRRRENLKSHIIRQTEGPLQGLPSLAYTSRLRPSFLCMRVATERSGEMLLSY